MRLGLKRNFSPGQKRITIADSGLGVAPNLALGIDVTINQSLVNLCLPALRCTAQALMSAPSPSSGYIYRPLGA